MCKRTQGQCGRLMIRRLQPFSRMKDSFRIGGEPFRRNRKEMSNYLLPCAFFFNQLLFSLLQHSYPRLLVVLLLLTDHAGPA